MQTGGCREQKEGGESRGKSDPLVFILGLRHQGFLSPGKSEEDGGIGQLRSLSSAFPGLPCLVGRHQERQHGYIRPANILP